MGVEITGYTHLDKITHLPHVLTFREAYSKMANFIPIVVPLILENSDVSEVESDESDEMDALLDILEPLVERKARNCIQNYVEDVVPAYSDRECVTHFRVSRLLCADLSKRFSESDIYQSLIAAENSRASISPTKHLLAFLWFAGHEAAGFRDVADRFNISIYTLHMIITRVSLFLSEMAPQVIKWPTAEDRDNDIQYFMDKKKLPVFAAVDGSHIPIDRPSENPDDYINRKGFCSMILQGICDKNRKFIDVFIGYPGSVHDARVFRNSDIFGRLPDLCGGGLIAGDSAYPCLTTVLTPYKDNGHLTQAQKYFNREFSSCRVMIEHTFGILKQRFRELYHLKLRGSTRIAHFVWACCVLHNIANEDDLEAFDGENPLPDNQPLLEVDYEAPAANGADLRDEICRQLLQHRQ